VKPLPIAFIVITLLTDISDSLITLNNVSSETDVYDIGDPAAFLILLFYTIYPEPPAFD
jgi:hypothetical protein